MTTTGTDIWERSNIVKTPSTATGSGALSETISYPQAFELEEIRIKVGVAPTTAENLTITIDAAAGAAYDVVLAAIPMAGVTSYRWADDTPSLLVPGDKIVIAWANTDTRTWGITYIYRRVK